MILRYPEPDTDDWADWLEYRASEEDPPEPWTPDESEPEPTDNSIPF